MLWLTTTLFSFIYLIQNAFSKYICSFHFYGVTVIYTLMAIENLGIGISASVSSLESALASALKKYNVYRFFLVLNYGISATLLQIFFSLWFPLFIHLNVSICVLEKSYLNFRKHPSVGVLIKSLLRKFLDASQQNI